MKNFIKILILPVAIIIMLGGFSQRAFAFTTITPTSLSVQFIPNPLFNQPNFLPLDETSGVVIVANNSGASQTILTEAINILDNDNLGSLLHLKIVGSSGTLFDNSLANFFRAAGELPLGAIASGESKTFTYTISFIDSSDNSYQGKTLGFDVCVGFQGGNNQCGNTVIGGENSTNGGGGTGNPPPGGTIPGSGGGGGPITLVITNEQENNILSGTTVTINWDTNKLSTSQVVYGLASGGPYSLVLVPTYFGYPLATTEDPTKVMHHSVVLIGLTPGQTYVYRVISHASPPTVSFEHRFTVPSLALNNSNSPDNPGNIGNINNNSGNSNPGTDLSINTNTGGSGGTGNPSTNSGFSGGSSQESAPAESSNGANSNNNLTANALFSNLGNLISNNIWIFVLLLLLILYIIWRLAQKRT